MNKKEQNSQGNSPLEQAIRDYLAKKPKATPTEVSDALKGTGVDVSVGLVSKVKYTKNKPNKKGSVNTVAARRLAPASLSVADLLEVKKLADQLGSLKTMRQALDTLEQLR